MDVPQIVPYLVSFGVPFLVLTPFALWRGKLSARFLLRGHRDDSDGAWRSSPTPSQAPQCSREGRGAGAASVVQQREP